MIHKPWWKILTFIILMYVCTMGLLVEVPKLDGRMQHTVRNLFFHVPMWFGQLILITVSLVYSILYLRKPNHRYDIIATEFARTGTVMGCLGLITGAIWANYTWGAAWSNDPKQIGAAIALLIYVAYFVLRNSMPDMDKRSRVAAVYNIFAYFIYIPMIMILPRLTESLHPGGKGNEGNPGLGGSSLDATMETVFWPAVFGWTLLSTWISTLRLRVRVLEEKKHSA
jgi:heme exporter protein C